MKDWKKIADAANLAIPDSEFDRITAALDSLEKSFRPLVAALPFQLGMAVVYLNPEEDAQ